MAIQQQEALNDNKPWAVFVDIAAARCAEEHFRRELRSLAGAEKAAFGDRGGWEPADQAYDGA